MPHNVCITLRIIPEDTSATFGLRLRAADKFASGYDLTFRVPERLVELHHETIYAVDGLHRPFLVEVMLKDDIIDVCIDNRRCLVNRCPELHGNHLFFFAQNADVVFDEIELRPLY